MWIFRPKKMKDKILLFRNIRFKSLIRQQMDGYWSAVRTTKERLTRKDLLRDEKIEIFEVKAASGEIFTIGDKAYHPDFGNVIIDSFRVVKDNLDTEDVCEVRFITKGAYWLSRVEDIGKKYDKEQHILPPQSRKTTSKDMLLLL